jgi:16S rRNA (cytidine1402-2'-O)-methyltransferase
VSAAGPPQGANSAPAGGSAAAQRQAWGDHIRATLYLVPNLLGVVEPTRVLPARTIAVARSLTHWVVETPKAARAFLKTIDVGQPIASLHIESLPEDGASARCAALLAPARAGRDVGLLSDAGCPGVADPGAALVAAAHAANIRVVPLVGPCAILLALMAAGMNGQRFAFHGYLPVKPDARAQALARLEQASRAEDCTQLFIETPYRNAAMIEACARTLQPGTIVCVAADLTLSTETIERRTARAWRDAEATRFDRRPALFLLYAPKASKSR